jgi:hypothetical protein
VRWWRGCHFFEPGIEADSTTIIAESDVVDSLWMNRTWRRAIRVSFQEIDRHALIFFAAWQMATCL